MIIVRRVFRKMYRILFPVDKRKFYSALIEMQDSVLESGFSIIAPFADARKYVKVGKDSMLSCNIHFESSEGFVSIGDEVYIGNSQLICRSSITLENNIFVAWGCTFYDHDSHSLDYRERRKDIASQIFEHKKGNNFIKSKNWDVVQSKPIHICSDAWIGMNSVILKGVRIGRGSIVGANSVVTKDVPDWCVVAGNPARIIKHLNIKE